jgi:hypothetical protein
VARTWRHQANTGDAVADVRNLWTRRNTCPV